MRASSPLPSPPSPGSVASPSNGNSEGPIPPACERSLKPDILGAHARLAAIDPSAPAAPLENVLKALLLGAGASRGLAMDPRRPEQRVERGLAPDPAALSRLLHALDGAFAEMKPVPADVIAGLFASDAPADPRAIPLTANEELLAVVILDVPPDDPVGFASVTAHAASLLAVIRMSEKVQKSDFELKYRVWELESLYDVGLSIAGTLDMESLADDILLKSVSLLNARQGTLIVRDISGEGRVLAKHFGEPLLDGDVEADLPDDGLVANRREERPAFLRDAPAQKIMAIPILSEGRRLGTLLVADKENRAGGVDDFDHNDKRILALFGNQAAIALENARLHRDAVEKERIEREIELAASIQKTILPVSLPDVAGLLLAGGNRPTRQVGGDYFDVYPLADGRTAFCVADVSGKGVPAALLVSTVHACLHLLVPAIALDLTSLVARVNRHLAGFSSTRKFVTLFLAVFEPASRVLQYVNAGHNPGIWLAGDGRTLTLLPAGGLPIGMLPNVTHKQASVPMSAGDTLVLYSDGITEAINAAEEEFGMERLTQLVRAGRTEPPGELSQRIFSAVSDFTRGVAQYDDQTVLIARVA
jgi:sigma-B regulation protein RsbU (phosphoserine phosphatase)